MITWEQGLGPAQFFCGSARSHADQSREIVKRDQPVDVDHGADRKDHRCGDRGPQELSPNRRDRRRARIGAARDLAAFFLAAHAERQHGEQHDPPDQKVNGDGGGQRHGVVTGTALRCKIKVKNKTSLHAHITLRIRMLHTGTSARESSNVALRVFGFLAALFVASLSSSAPAAAGGSGCYGYDCHNSGYYYVLVQQSPCGSCGRGLFTSTWSPCGYTRCQPAIVIPTTCGGSGGFGRVSH